MASQITLYWDYKFNPLPASLGGGDELEVTLYPTKEREDLQEWLFDEKELLESTGFELLQTIEYEDPEFPTFDELYDENDDGSLDRQLQALWDEAKKRGVLEKWLCKMFNDGNSDYEPELGDIWDKAYELEESK